MKSLFQKLIRGYQKTRGIRKYLWIYLFGYSRVCRHYPTCSDYARQSIGKYGVMKGSAMGLWRILRCRG